MCKMWEKIRYGVRWKPRERFALACRSLNLKSVKSVDISFDPLRPGNESIRSFWSSINAPRTKLTNPQVRIKTDIRNDRQPPYFIAHLESGKKLRFNTDNMASMDLVMRFNRLTGQPELGKTGTRPLPHMQKDA
ncbi:hypothetical protein WR25_03528 [Diploscapter pachys]|uniref:Ribosomal protein/NADH dehydrogenase domain-containing protein n=1 Tax=Diploscapter pachys TaxID=2018661 RepID=A0A2A2JCH6_9BILA|nr:hypothetical protein WR25_03528 [Diploscapter pachys]